MHSDGEHYHFVWGPGRAGVEAPENEEVKAAYSQRGEGIVPLGVHGTMVAIDWDSCVADGACIEAVQCRYSSGIELKMMCQQWT